MRVPKLTQLDSTCLSESFEQKWAGEISKVAESKIDGNDIATTLGIQDANTEYEIEIHDDARALATEDGILGQWPSRDALIADIAASRVLNHWATEWET
ncbi:hypothetical protein GCM10009037_29640 [Halarchaeum grantii]|uniref:DUF8054 domain-containing protein n=1 Tax=Halarchaeum grantii TaxID=1193105 RepID=A0A830EZ40_9EURY|nr:hypothetical protein GCM10009037_29640 [Halarchaeum grantii]